MNKKIIHVGLPKTGTTFFQNKVFPNLCKETNYKYIGKNGDRNKYFFQMMYLKYAISNNFEIKKKFGLKNNYLVSHEGLLPGDPEFWEIAAKKIKFFFGNDCHIIISIRQPSTFLTSIYQEHCLTQGYFIGPERFFLNNQNYNMRINEPKFNISKFDFDLLIKIFKENFNNVSIFKFEDIFNKTVFLDNLGFNKNIINKLDFDSLKTKSVNTSISIRGMKLLRFIAKILNRFGLNIQPRKSNYLISDFEKYMNGTNYINKKKIFNFNILELFRKYIDPLIGSKKVEINFENVDVDINKLDKKYLRYPQVIFKKGKS